MFRLTANRKIYAQQAEAVGAEVTRAGYALLRTLAEIGPVASGELARRSHMDPGATVRQVKAPEADALVDRLSGTDDARLTLVSLTPLGREVVADIVEVRIDHLMQVMADWPPEESAQFAALVDRLAVGLRSTPFNHTSRMCT